MTDRIIVVQPPVPAKVIESNVGPQGPQGPQGVPGTASYTVNKFQTNATLAFVPQVALVDASSGPVTITLPVPTGALYYIDIIKIDATANLVTVDGNGNNINGLPTQQWNDPQTSLTVITDGTEWFIT